MSLLRISEHFLGLFLSEELKEEVSGDLEEAFQKRSIKKGKFFAYLFLLYELLYSLRLANKRIIKLNTDRPMHLLTHLKLGIRFIWKTRSYSLINILGLSIGLIMAGYAWFFVSDQFTYDSYHKNSDRVYRIGYEIDFKGEIEKDGGASFIMGEEFKSRVPAIEASTQIKAGYPLHKVGSENRELVVHFANKDLFKILDFEFRFGNPNYFEDPSGLFVSESFYRSLENRETIELLFNQELYVFNIEGVFQDVPINSSFNPKVLIPTSFYPNIVHERRLKTWFDINMNVLVMLHTDAKVREVENQLSEIIGQEETDLKAGIFLQPFTEIHTDTSFTSGNGLIGTIERDILNILLFTGLLCLLISTINFSIFSQGNYLKRIKEVGIRKTVGANRQLVFWQFMVEVSLNIVIAVVLAFIAQILLLPVFSSYIGQQYPLSSLLNIQYLGGLIILMVLSIAISGVYPAIYLSKQKVLNAMQGHKSSANSKTSRFFLSFQAALSIFMLVVTLSANQQLNFLLNYDLGYDDNNLLFASIRLPDKHEILKEELLKIPGVNQVSFNSGYNGTRLKEEYDQVSVRHLHMDPDFVELIDLQIEEGRNLDPSITSDKTGAILINQNLASRLDIEDPIGQTLPFSYGDFTNPTIVGAVADYHFLSPKYANQPLVMYLAPAYPYQYLFIKTETKNAEIVSDIANTFNEIYAPFSFDYQWMTDYNMSMMQTEEKVSRASFVGSLIAIVLSALGLLGVLGTHIESRLKALSIHKINGANSGHLYQIFLRSYTPWIVAGLLVGLYPAYLMINRWLESYANRIELNMILFGLGAVGCFSIFLAIMLFQLNRLNRLNPVEFLRNE